MTDEAMQELLRNSDRLGKKFKQIKDLSDSYVVNDNVEIGMGNKIPLWLFGFLY